jgi:uncharacterized membrane protein YhfC
MTQLSPWILLSGVGMLVVSIAFIIVAFRAGGTWGYLGLGALMWVVTVAVKFLIAIPINPPLYKAIYDTANLWAPGSLLFDLYVGALTGITEVLLCWKLLRIKHWGNAPWRKALAFGIGFGAFEALLLGGSNLFSTSVSLAMPQAIPESALRSLSVLNDPLYGLAPVAERFGTILAHIFCSVLIFYTIASGKSRWVWIAFAYKTLLDAIAGFAQMWGVETLPKIWTIEALILILGMIAGFGIWKVKQAYPETPEPKPPLETVLSPE